MHFTAIKTGCALVMVFILVPVGGQSFQHLDIGIEQDSIDELESHPYTNEDVHGNFAAEGILSDTVELHYRGAYNLLSLIRKGSLRNWKVKFAKTQRFENRREWNFNYETTVRQNLSYKVFSQAGVPCVSAENVVLSVNGVRQGVYLKYEDPDNKNWLADVFGNDEGDLYKAAFDMPDQEKYFAPLSWLGDRDEDYFLHYRKQTNINGEAEFDYRSIRKFIEFINHSPDEVFAGEIEQCFAIEPFIRYLVVSNYISNWDSYPFRPKNYFLYQNPADSLWYYIPWDLDGTFQEAGGRNPIGTTGSVFHYFDGPDPYDHTPTEPLERPLVWRIMAIEKYRNLYIREYQEALGTYLKEDRLRFLADSILARVEPNATSEEYGKYSWDAGRVKDFITARQENVALELARYDLRDVYLTHHPYSDPENLGGWELNEALSDEFVGGGVNEDRWFIQGTGGAYQNNFKGRAPSQFVPANVDEDAGYLKITSKWEPDFDFLEESMGGYRYGAYAPITTGAIISRNTFHYGFMEVRARAADGPVSSAFWTTGDYSELDVFEHFGNNPGRAMSDRKYQSSFHDWRAGSPTFSERIWTNEHFLDFRVAEDFHVYGLEWDPDYLRIYVDGRLIRYVSRGEMGNAWILDDPQKIWLDCETFYWEVKPENMRALDFAGGISYEVDYVRVWQREGGLYAGGRGENLVVNPGLEEGLAGWTAGGAARAVSDDPFKGEGAVKLNGLGSLQQAVRVKPGTTYILSARIKTPGTNMSNIWHNAYLGVRAYGGSEVSIQYFRPEYTLQSLQFRTGATDTLATIFFSNSSVEHLAIADDFSLVESRNLHDWPYVEVSGVRMEQDSISLYVDSTASLVAGVLPLAADERRLLWNSVDTTVVKVDEAGKLVGTGAGTTWVRVQSLEGGFIDNCVVTVLANAPLAHVDQPLSEELSLYPNPASDILHIRAPGADQLFIYNAAGMPELRMDLYGEDPEAFFRLDVSGLAKGVYFITALSGDKIVTRKLVLSH